MRIAILTLPLHSNYGGILQAYALQTVLESMGHDVEVLQRLNTDPRSKFRIIASCFKRFAKKIIYHDTEVFPERRKIKENEIILKHIKPFLDKNMRLRQLKRLTDLDQNNYDAVIVGSDQIWRYPYFTSLWKAKMPNAYLDFIKNGKIRKIAYAASFGLDNIEEYPQQVKIQCGKALEHFDAISVRESSGRKIIEKEFNNNSDWVLDPTLLLDMNSYLNLIEDRIHINDTSKKLMYYILDATSFKNYIVNKIANDYCLDSFTVHSPVNDQTLPVDKRIQKPIEDWLKGFRDAEVIVTDSFHACIFSIIFRKPFIVIGNQGRGMARFNSLLNQFHLESNLIMPGEDEIDIKVENILKSKNSYEKVFRILQDKKDDSLRFIKDNLIIS